MKIQLSNEDIAKAIFVYLALKGHNADVTTMKSGVSVGDMFSRPSLEYISVECKAFEKPVDVQKIHKLVMNGEL